MKRQKKMFMVLMALGMAIFLAAPVYAAPVWYNCTVVLTGVSTNVTPNAYYARLTGTAEVGGGTITNRDCLIPSTAQNQMLATMLTAMSSGLQVYVLIDPALAHPPIVNGYLKNN